MQNNNTDQNYFDVVIVGGGLVGISLALSLPTQFKVAIIEKNTRVALSVADHQKILSLPNHRAIALSWTSKQILSRLNVWPRLLPWATPIQKVHISEQGVFSKIRFSAEDESIPALGYVIDSQILVHGLQKQTEEHTNIHWFEQTIVEVIDVLPESATISLQSVSGNQTVTAAMLIAADGTQSSIRKQVGIEIDSKDYQQTAILAHLELSRPHQFIAYERFGPNGTMALLPVGENKGTLIWTVPTKKAAQLLALTVCEFQTEVMHHLEYYIGAIVQCGERFAYPLHAVRAQASYQKNVLLLGNAAHTLHPIAAQGFNLALRDTYQLAEIIKRNINERDHINVTQIYHDYDKERLKDQKQIMLFTDYLIRMFTSDFWPLYHARHLGLKLVSSVSIMKKFLLRRFLGFAG
jgi:2-octaprenyl-6-methoxyphenol hydroxylase